MSFISLFALAGAMFLLAITPGPGVFATVARALASGFKYSAVVVAGIVTGDLIFLLFAIFGLSAIAENLHGVFLIIKYVGAAYLIFLGIKLWREKPREIQIRGIKDHSWKSNFLAGLFITLGNPKVILFYLGFLPTFVDLSSLSGADVFAIASVVSLVLGATMLAYGFAASNTRRLLRNTRSQRLMNRSAGSAMIFTGAVLATKT